MEPETPGRQAPGPDAAAHGAGQPSGGGGLRRRHLLFGGAAAGLGAIGCGRCADRGLRVHAGGPRPGGRLQWGRDRAVLRG